MVSVESRRDTSLRGIPLGVMQYNPYDAKELGIDDVRRINDSDGSLIAVSYEAPDSGIKRGMRGKEARLLCKDLVLVTVPCNNKKADVSIYRDAGAEVVAVLSRFASACERLSIDEVYLDITTKLLKKYSTHKKKPPARGWRERTTTPHS